MGKKWIILYFLFMLLCTTISFGENHSQNYNIDTKESCTGEVAVGKKDANTPNMELENSMPIKEKPPERISTIQQILHFWQTHYDGFMELFTKSEPVHEKGHQVNK